MRVLESTVSSEDTPIYAINYSRLCAAVEDATHISVKIRTHVLLTNAVDVVIDGPVNVCVANALDAAVKWEHVI